MAISWSIGSVGSTGNAGRTTLRTVRYVMDGYEWWWTAMDNLEVVDSCGHLWTLAALVGISGINGFTDTIMLNKYRICT